MFKTVFNNVIIRSAVAGLTVMGSGTFASAQDSGVPSMEILKNIYRAKPTRLMRKDRSPTTSTGVRRMFTQATLSMPVCSEIQPVPTQRFAWHAANRSCHRQANLLS